MTPKPRSWPMMLAGLLVVAVLTLVGAFVTIGCLLAIMFELDAKWRPTDGPRIGYLVLLGGGASLGIAVPVASGLMLLRSRRVKVVALVLGLFAAVGAIASMGLGFAQ